MDAALLIVRLLLASIFAVAGVAKLAHPAATDGGLLTLGHLWAFEERRLGIRVHGQLALPTFTLPNARGIYTFEDLPPDVSMAWEYRLRIRDQLGQVATTLPTLSVPEL